MGGATSKDSDTINWDKIQTADMSETRNKYKLSGDALELITNLDIPFIESETDNKMNSFNNFNTKYTTNNKTNDVLSPFITSDIYKKMIDTSSNISDIRNIQKGGDLDEDSSTSSTSDFDTDEISDVEDNKPKYGDNKPKYGDNKPKHVDNKPKYGDNKPKHVDNKPKYGDNKPKHGDTKPKHGDNKPKHGDTKHHNHIKSEDEEYNYKDGSSDESDKDESTDESDKSDKNESTDESDKNESTDESDKNESTDKDRSSDKDELESEEPFLEGNDDYLSSSAHTGGEYSEENTVTDEMGHNQININTSDINMISDHNLR